MTKLISLIAACMLTLTGVAHAEPDWLTTAQNLYPAAVSVHNCGLCHNNFFSNSPRNPYGLAFEGAVGTVQEKLEAIELVDSDGDGTTNVFEIQDTTGFFPGWSCDNLGDAINAPANLEDLADPLDIGCLGAGSTSSTLPQNTTTSSSTTTTIPELGCVCGDPVFDGETNPTDALLILLFTVGLTNIDACPPPCCDVDGTPDITINDALWLLEVAAQIRTSDTFACPDATTSTTSTTLAQLTTTTSSTTTTHGTCDTTTTTLPQATTSTTSTTCDTTSTTLPQATTSSTSTSTTTTTTTTSTTLALPNVLEVVMLDSDVPVGALSLHVNFAGVTGGSIPVDPVNNAQFDCEGAGSLAVVGRNPATPNTQINYAMVDQGGLSVGTVIRCPLNMVPGSPVPVPGDVTIIVTDASDVNAVAIADPTFGVSFLTE